MGTRGNFSAGGLFLGLLMLFAPGILLAATVDVQAVNASSTGPAGKIPPSLAPYKNFLKGYGTLADAGKEQIAVPVGKSNSASVGGATVKISTVSSGNGKSTIQVSIDGRPPVEWTMKQGQSARTEIEKGGGSAVIFIITMTSSD